MIDGQAADRANSTASICAWRQDKNESFLLHTQQTSMHTQCIYNVCLSIPVFKLNQQKGINKSARLLVPGKPQALCKHLTQARVEAACEVVGALT